MKHIDNKFPREDILLICLAMGYTGSLAIADQELSNITGLEVHGQQAVMCGCFLLGAATYYLYRCYRVFHPYMMKWPASYRYAFVYVFILMGSFLHKILAIHPRINAGGILISYLLLFVGGHRFYRQMEKMDRGQTV